MVVGAAPSSRARTKAVLPGSAARLAPIASSEASRAVMPVTRSPLIWCGSAGSTAICMVAMPRSKPITSVPPKGVTGVSFSTPVTAPDAAVSWAVTASNCAFGTAARKAGANTAS